MAFWAGAAARLSEHDAIVTRTDRMPMVLSTPMSRSGWSVIGVPRSSNRPRMFTRPFAYDASSIDALPRRQRGPSGHRCKAAHGRAMRDNDSYSARSMAVGGTM